MTDIEKLKSEHKTMMMILGLIASGAIYGDNCRAIANTTLNELGGLPSNNTFGDEK